MRKGINFGPTAMIALGVFVGIAAFCGLASALLSASMEQSRSDYREEVRMMQIRERQRLRLRMKRNAEEREAALEERKRAREQERARREDEYRRNRVDAYGRPIPYDAPL